MKNIIDQTLLKPNADRAEFESFCAEAVEYRFGCIALLPNYVGYGAKCLNGSGVRILSAVSYPRGTVDVELKRQEIMDSLENGADEIDMVLNLAAIKLGDFGKIAEEVAMLRETAPDNITKVILETTLLSEDEIVKCCRIACDNEIDFVKTSTGYNGNKASLAAVRLMHGNIDGRTRVKAAGGINSLEDFLAMVKAGASRIGTSNGRLIMDQFAATGKTLEELLEA